MGVNSVRIPEQQRRQQQERTHEMELNIVENRRDEVDQSIDTRH